MHLLVHLLPAYSSAHARRILHVLVGPLLMQAVPISDRWFLSQAVNGHVGHARHVGAQGLYLLWNTKRRSWTRCWRDGSAIPEASSSS